MIKKFLLIFVLSLFSIFLIGSLAQAADPSSSCSCICRDSVGKLTSMMSASKEQCEKDCQALTPARTMEDCCAEDDLTCGIISGTPGAPSGGTPGAPSGGTPGAPSGGGTERKVATLEPPISATTIPSLIGRIIKAFLGIIGSISLVIFVYAGFILLTSQGNPGRIKTGQDTIVYASIGILVVLASYALLNFVFKVFQ